MYYVGVKIVRAEPKERIDGELIEQGYRVMYSDGYESWSPKEIFEAAYLPVGEEANSVTEAMVDLFTGKEYHATNLPDGKSTLVSCKTASGFMLHEVSSCVDPRKYDSILGSRIALDRIKDKMWAFLGFVIQWGKNGINTKIGLNKGAQ
jgi:hypothetical protein